MFARAGGITLLRRNINGCRQTGQLMCGPYFITDTLVRSENSFNIGVTKTKNRQYKYLLLIADAVLCLLFITVITCMDITERNKVQTESVENFVFGDSSEPEYKVDGYSREGKYITVRGWAVIPGKTYPFYNYGEDRRGEAVYCNVRLACVDEVAGKVALFPTQLYERNDATETLNDGINYRCAGFCSRIPECYEKAVEKNGLYAVFTEPDGEKKLYAIEIEKNQ